jgi:hypothetical protein
MVPGIAELHSAWSLGSPSCTRHGPWDRRVVLGTSIRIPERLGLGEVTEPGWDDPIAGRCSQNFPPSFPGYDKIPESTEPVCRMIPVVKSFCQELRASGSMRIMKPPALSHHAIGHQG